MQSPSPPAYAPAQARASGSPVLVLVLHELRARQWLKNGLVFFALVYALQLVNPPLALRALAAFAAFCCISSAGYIFNDLRDLDLDRLHPTKRRRPIASGQLAATPAVVLGVVLLAAGFGTAGFLGLAFVGVCAAYLALTTSYSLWWKHVVLLDTFSIAAGFVLRTVAGAVAIDVPVSPWLYVCTVMGSLLIAFAKRRSEIAGAEHSAEASRPALEHYTVEFLDQLIIVAATTSVIAYSLYTFVAEHAPRNHLLMLTIPVVLYGVFRYLYLVRVRRLGGSPEELLLHDRSLLAAVVLFFAVSIGVLYLAPRGL